MKPLATGYRLLDTIHQMSDVSTLSNDATAQRHVENTLILSAMTGATLYQTVYGDIPRLFLYKGLGASPFYVGLLTTLCSLTVLGTLLGTVLVYRMGKVRLLRWGRLAGLVPVACMIVLAALGERGPVITMLALSSCCAFALIINIGTTSWWPLLQDKVPEGTMGKFFARMRTRLRGVEVGLPIAMGFWLGADPSARQFILPFAIGAAAMLLGAQILSRLPDRPEAPPDVGLPLRMRLAWRDRHVRSYAIFMASFGGIMALATPFWMVMLIQDPKNPFAGLPAIYVVFMSAVAAIGHMLSLKIWAHLVDRHGGRPASSLSIVLSAAAGAAWLVLPQGGWMLYVWAIVFYFAWGILEGGVLMGRTWSMLRSVPKAYQADGFTLVMLAQAGGAALGALAGGAIFDVLTRRAAGGSSIFGLDVRALYLCGAQLALLIAYVASRRLVGYEKQTPTRDILRGVWERISD